MAKKKAGKKKSAKNATTKKKKVVRKSTVKKSAVKKKAVRKKPANKKAANKKSAKKKTTARKKTTKNISLGRPIIPADARLDRVFQKDYRAREIFAFLRVKTIRELEEYTPKKIVDLLTGPMVQSVQRIRKTLALGNRSLAKDQKFALDFKSQWKLK